MRDSRSASGSFWGYSRSVSLHNGEDNNAHRPLMFSLLGGGSTNGSYRQEVLRSVSPLARISDQLRGACNRGLVGSLRDYGFSRLGCGRERCRLIERPRKSVVKAGGHCWVVGLLADIKRKSEPQIKASDQVYVFLRALSMEIGPYGATKR